MRSPAIALAVTLIAGPAVGAGPFDPFAVARIDQVPGARAPLDAPLLDESGRRVSLRSLAQGRPILLVPVQHRCPNLCGVTLEGLAHALVSERADVELVAFGIDPREGPTDAAVSVRRLRTALGSRSPAVVNGVTGAAGQVAAVTGALGYRYAWDARIGQYAHAAAAAVLRPDGRLSSWIYGVQPPPGLVRAAVAAARGDGPEVTGERLLLLCYHFDAATGRYDSLVLQGLRLGLLLVAFALAAFVAMRVRRARRLAP